MNDWQYSFASVSSIPSLLSDISLCSERCYVAKTIASYSNSNINHRLLYDNVKLSLLQNQPYSSLPFICEQLYVLAVRRWMYGELSRY